LSILKNESSVNWGDIVLLDNAQVNSIAQVSGDCIVFCDGVGCHLGGCFQVVVWAFGGLAYLFLHDICGFIQDLGVNGLARNLRISFDVIVDYSSLVSWSYRSFVGFSLVLDFESVLFNSFELKAWHSDWFHHDDSLHKFFAWGSGVTSHIPVEALGVVSNGCFAEVVLE